MFAFAAFAIALVVVPAHAEITKEDVKNVAKKAQKVAIQGGKYVAAPAAEIVVALTTGYISLKQSLAILDAGKRKDAGIAGIFNKPKPSSLKNDFFSPRIAKRMLLPNTLLKKQGQAPTSMKSRIAYAKNYATPALSLALIADAGRRIATGATKGVKKAYAYYQERKAAAELA